MLLVLGGAACFLIVKVLGDAEHETVESSLVPHLHLPLISIALALMLSAHVAA